MSQKALFLCGSLNQTTMMHKISSNLPEFDAFFAPFYAEGGLNLLRKIGVLEHSILGGNHRKSTLRYLRREKLPIDKNGSLHNYDLVVTCTDLIVQSNIRNKRLLLVQEGITEPENLAFTLVKYLKFPRYLANTAATGLSDQYDLFCVASAGYRDLFIKKGVNPEKIIVTGIPNFDNAQEAFENDFPYHNFVLVATSSIRETGKFDARMDFLNKVKQIAAGRQTIFRLHPNEEQERAIQEIRSVFPDALIFTEGNTNHMIANCSVLITQVSSVVYTGIALQKEVHSYFNLEELNKLAPIQNKGTSAQKIADVCRNLVKIPVRVLRSNQPKRQLAPDFRS